MSQVHNDFWFPKSLDWDFYLFEPRDMKLAAGEERQLLERYESGWVTWLFMRCDNKQIRLRLRIETPEGVVAPWSYTPEELFIDTLTKWLPRYDTLNNIYVIDAQFNPWLPYNVTLRLDVINEDTTQTATINKLKLLRIKLQSSEGEK